MAYIKVDHSKFEQASNTIRKYVDKADKQMKNADIKVGQLKGAYEGADYEAFREKWNELDDKDSAYKNMMKSLETYADYLDYASKQYKKAQVNAINRAFGLRR